VPVTDVPGRLETLIGELRTLGSPIGRYLRPGRTEAEIRATLGALDLAPPAELVDWYAWHDGVDHVAAARLSKVTGRRWRSSSASRC
jgi:hypothetical protein